VAAEPLLVDQAGGRRDRLVGREELLLAAGGAADRDSLRDGLQVRAGEAPGVPAGGLQQRVDHPGRGRLAVRAGQVHGRRRRQAEQRAQTPDPLQRRFRPRPGPAREQGGLGSREVHAAPLLP
jgi:hypothetical protein